LFDILVDSFSDPSLIAGRTNEFHKNEYESDESWNEGNEELEIEDDDDGLFVPNSTTKRPRKLNTTRGPSRKKIKYSGSCHDVCYITNFDSFLDVCLQDEKSNNAKSAKI
jgi:hypothetical protein